MVIAQVYSVRLERTAQVEQLARSRVQSPLASTVPQGQHPLRVAGALRAHTVQAGRDSRSRAHARPGLRAPRGPPRRPGVNAPLGCSASVGQRHRRRVPLQATSVPSHLRPKFRHHAALATTALPRARQSTRRPRARGRARAREARTALQRPRLGLAWRAPRATIVAVAQRFLWHARLPLETFVHPAPPSPQGSHASWGTIARVWRLIRRSAALATSVPLELRLRSHAQRGTMAPMRSLRTLVALARGSAPLLRGGRVRRAQHR